MFTQDTDSIAASEIKSYRYQSSLEPITQCSFLSNPAENGSVSPDRWEAVSSILVRFKDGAQWFHAIRKKFVGYSTDVAELALELAKTGTTPKTCSAIEKLGHNCASCPMRGKVKSPYFIEKELPSQSRGFYTTVNKVTGEPLKDPKPHYADLMELFYRENPYRVVPEQTLNICYRFNGTHFAPFFPLEIKSYAEQHFVPPPKETHRKEFLAKVISNHLGDKDFFIRSIEGKINFQNGVYDSITKNLEPHTPEYGFRYVLPFDYDPHAQCPTFEAWLKEVMLGDMELVDLVQEIMGYVVRGGEYKYHKAFWLAGSGRNGKSTLLDVIKALVGPLNYTVASLSGLANNTFTSAELEGKWLNVSEETTPDELENTGIFKNLTGDGDLLAQRKNAHPFTLHNRAKLIMTYNEMPNLTDLSDGMQGRLVIIPFKLDLTEDLKQDKTLKPRLLAELSGIFNFAVRGWERLERQNAFSQSAKANEAKDELIENSCSAAQWVKTHITYQDIEGQNPDGFVRYKVAELHQMYVAAHEQPKYAYGPDRFGKALRRIKKMSERYKRSEEYRYYFGIVISK